MSLITLGEFVAAPAARERLGFNVDTPKAGATCDSAALAIAGWVVAPQCAVRTVTVFHQGAPLRVAKVGLARPDVAERYPQHAWARTAGFGAHVLGIELPETFELSFMATLEDETRVPLGRLSGTFNADPPVAPDAPPYPLICTSLGRTGTTWLMRLLAEHPAIVAHRAYPYETRACSYWMHALRVLAQPASFAQPGENDPTYMRSGVLGHPPFHTAGFARELPAAGEWLGDAYVRGAEQFCVKSIDGFYHAVAKGQGQAAPVYFAEKVLPDSIPTMVRHLYPRTREIFLVRDFRDVMVSIAAFNAKRGFDDFGRKGTRSIDEMARRMKCGAQALLASWRTRAASGHLVRYEDLVTRPQETLAGILSYLHLDKDEEQIERMLTQASRDTAELQGHRTSRDAASSVARWRTDLDANAQSVCARELGGVLQAFGYPVDSGGNGEADVYDEDDARAGVNVKEF